MENTNLKELITAEFESDPYYNTPVKVVTQRATKSETFSCYADASIEYNLPEIGQSQNSDFVQVGNDGEFTRYECWASNNALSS